jgi:hypothetical protein
MDEDGVPVNTEINLATTVLASQGGLCSMELPTFYETQRFITMFTQAFHWTMPSIIAIHVTSYLF